MIPIVVFSNDKITNQLKSLLGNFFSISTVCEKETEVLKNAQILLLQHKTKQRVKTDGIAIFSSSFYPDSKEHLCSIAVVDSSNCKYIDIGTKTQYITCGMSTKDTITFSSIEDREVCVSLLRGIKDIYGNEIEPFEVLIETCENLSNYTPFSLLTLVAVLTVLGKNISGKKLFLK